MNIRSGEKSTKHANQFTIVSEIQFVVKMQVMMKLNKWKIH